METLFDEYKPLGSRLVGNSQLQKHELTVYREPGKNHYVRLNAEDSKLITDAGFNTIQVVKSKYTGDVVLVFLKDNGLLFTVDKCGGIRRNDKQLVSDIIDELGIKQESINLRTTIERRIKNDEFISFVVKNVTI